MIKRNLKEARYSDSVPKEKRGWWYFTTHGVMPGSIPRGVNVLDTREGQNKKGTRGTFVKLDAILNTDELRYYDMIELVPESEYEDLSITEQIELFKSLKNNGFTGRQLKEKFSAKLKQHSNRKNADPLEEDIDDEGAFDFDKFSIDLWENGWKEPVSESFKGNKSRRFLKEARYNNKDFIEKLKELIASNGIKMYSFNFNSEKNAYELVPTYKSLDSSELRDLEDKLYEIGFVIVEEDKRQREGYYYVPALYVLPDGMRPFDYLENQKNGIPNITPFQRPKTTTTTTTTPSSNSNEPTQVSDEATIKELLIKSGLMSSTDGSRIRWSEQEYNDFRSLGDNKYCFCPRMDIFEDRTYHWYTKEEKEQLTTMLKRLGLRVISMTNPNGGQWRKDWYRGIIFYIQRITITPIKDNPTKALQKLTNASSSSSPKTNVDISPYYPDQQILLKIKDYMDRNSWVNVGAIKSLDKIYKYYYAAHLLSWDSLKNYIRDKSNLSYDMDILDAIDNVARP